MCVGPIVRCTWSWAQDWVQLERSEWLRFSCKRHHSGLKIILLVLREAAREEIQNRLPRAERPRGIGSLIWDLLRAGWSMKQIRAMYPWLFTIRLDFNALLFEHRQKHKACALPKLGTRLKSVRYKEVL